MNSNRCVLLFASLEKDPQKSTSSSGDDVGEEDKLSEMDTRVLRSMLADSAKLDLQTEENLKKLLERGVVSKDVPRAPKKKDIDASNKDSEFSSQILQTLTDTKLWQAFSRKAGDWVESAKLYVVNRVERDAMTLAALGLFAWERAVRDVGRALPAAGGASSSSFSKQQQQPPAEKKPFLLAAKSSVEEMTTPLDELKSVGIAVAQILKTGGIEGASTGATATTRLRTAATSRQDRNNFQRAYERATEKAKNQQNLARATQRVAATVVDTAWQLTRELQVEANTPGYKTKQAKSAIEAAKDSTKHMLQGAQQNWRLERAKVKERRALAASEPSVANPIMAEVVLLEGVEQQQKSSQKDKDYAQRLDEATKRAERRQAESQELERLRMQKQQQQHQVTPNRVTQTRQATQRLFAMQFELQSECVRLEDQLQYCIVNPEQTWLRSDVIEGVREFDQELIRQVVSELIATRNSVKEIIKRQDQSNQYNQERNSNGDVSAADATIDNIVTELYSVRDMVEEIQDRAKQAVSLGAAQALKMHLLESCSKDRRRTEDDDVVPVLLRLEDIQHGLQVMMETIDQVEVADDQLMNWSDGGREEQPPSASFYEGATAASALGQDLLENWDYETFEVSHPANYNVDAVASIDPEIVDVIPEALGYAVAGEVISTNTKKFEVNGASSLVELVTDDDFEAAVGDTKQAVALGVDDDDEHAVVAKKDDPITNLLLRVLDIIFFLLEKTVTVRMGLLCGISYKYEFVRADHWYHTIIRWSCLRSSVRVR
jgi:hypothetical protein